MKPAHRILASALLLAMVAAPARAQVESREGIELQNQILELRQDIQNLQAANGGQGYSPAPVQQAPQTDPNLGGNSNDVAAQLTVRVSALEEQVRSLQGRVDDLANQLQRQNDTLSKQIGDLSFKLGQGTTQMSGPPQAMGAPDAGPSLGDPAGPPPPPPVKALPPPPRRTAELSLREGSAALARRDYAAAEAAAREVLANPKSPRATDARMMLARAESGQQQHQQAAADYYLVYNRAPKAAGTAPLALLGVANALIAMNDTKDACQALAKLNNEFRSQSASVKQSVSAARKRAACH